MQQVLAVHMKWAKDECVGDQEENFHVGQLHYRGNGQTDGNRRTRAAWATDAGHLLQGFAKGK